MRAGLRRDRIALERRVITVNASQQKVISWTLHSKIWAEALRQSETVARFTMLYRADVKPDTFRIVWDGAIWNITSAVHDQKRSTTTVDCDFSMMIEATSLESTEREYIAGLPLIRPRD